MSGTTIDTWLKPVIILSPLSHPALNFPCANRAMRSSSRPSSSSSGFRRCAAERRRRAAHRAGVSENLNGMPSIFKAPTVGCSTVSTMRRAAVCGSSSACATELILPHGTPAALSLASQASALSRGERLADQAVDRVAVLDARRGWLLKRGILRPFRMAEHLGAVRANWRVVADRERHHGVGGRDRSCRARCSDGRCRNGRRPCRRRDSSGRR